MIIVTEEDYFTAIRSFGRVMQWDSTVKMQAVENRPYRTVHCLPDPAVVSVGWVGGVPQTGNVLVEDPFRTLFGAFAWLFPAQSDSALPSALRPRFTMPGEATMPILVDIIKTNGRLLASDHSAHTHCVTIATGGPSHPVISTNAVLPSGCMASHLLTVFTRYWVLQDILFRLLETEAGFGGLAQGPIRLIGLIPEVDGGILPELGQNDVGPAIPKHAYSSPPMIVNPETFIAEIRNFIDMGAVPGAYTEPFIARTLCPALSAYRALNAEGKPDVPHALYHIRSVQDPWWRGLFERWANDRPVRS